MSDQRLKPLGGKTELPLFHNLLPKHKAGLLAYQIEYHLSDKLAQQKGIKSTGYLLLK